MKIHLQSLIIVTVLGLLSLPDAFGANPKIEKLSDAQLASVRGGFCFFFKCQGAPGDGVCQPIKDDAFDLCQHMTCKLELGTVGNTEVVECKAKGTAVTCTNVANYIQCIRSRYPSICLPDPGSSVCGNQTDAYCFPDVKTRQCFCDTETDDTACDWSSCLF